MLLLTTPGECIPQLIARSEYIATKYLSRKTEQCFVLKPLAFQITSFTYAVPCPTNLI